MCTTLMWGPSKQQTGLCASVSPGYYINQLLISPNQHGLMRKCKSYKFSSFYPGLYYRMLDCNSEFCYLKGEHRGKKEMPWTSLCLLKMLSSRLLFQKENKNRIINQGKTQSPPARVLHASTSLITLLLPPSLGWSVWLILKLHCPL